MKQQSLSAQEVSSLQMTSNSIRQTIISMLDHAQSGHTGGSLGMADIFAVLYKKVRSNHDRIVVSNGHLSPVVYATLSEVGMVNKKEVIKGFRQMGNMFEGHVSREVPGVEFGTGPLGIGVSVASGMALAKKRMGEEGTVFCTMGDGEVQEGQVSEMMHFAAKYKLDNLVIIVDFNKLQLSGATGDIMPLDVDATFRAAGFDVKKCDGHDHSAIYDMLTFMQLSRESKPKVLLASTLMGKGVSFMEEEAQAGRATWHGNPPSHDQAQKAIKELQQRQSEIGVTSDVAQSASPVLFQKTTLQPVNSGMPILYPSGTVTDCRSAYGAALLDLARINSSIMAMTADLGGSVKTDGVKEELPDQYVECGIAEQQMVSAAGGLSLSGVVPFVSTFGAFLTSRARDQARVNDINNTNVKMVSTHCGLSVGEDGPTHQSIDDMGSFLGLINTKVIEPADANQCDRMTRYIASHEGNYYMRMGRHKFPVIEKEDGEVFYDKHYEYTYGKCDLIRSGGDLTIAATGACVQEAVVAWERLHAKGIAVEVIAVSSIKSFDETLFSSLTKTKNLVTVEDHNASCGLGMTISAELVRRGINLKASCVLGVNEYQRSGTAEELYHAAGIDSHGIYHVVCKMI